MSPIPVAIPAVDDRSSPERRRAILSACLQSNPPAGIPQDEIGAHLRHMPVRYWNDLTGEDLAWHLALVHRFLRQSVAGSKQRGVLVEWRQLKEYGRAQVAVCEWDRRGLLAQIAAAFSALRINVCRAFAYTRGDSIALDLFEVCEPGGGEVDETKLKELAPLIEGALREPLGYIVSRLSEPIEEGEKTAGGLPRGPLGVAPRVRFCNRTESGATLLHVEAGDRLGLLYDLLQALADLDLTITGAVVETSGDQVRDVFALTEEKGRSITDLLRLKEIQQAVVDAVMEKRWAARSGSA